MPSLNSKISPSFVSVFWSIHAFPKIRSNILFNDKYIYHSFNSIYETNKETCREDQWNKIKTEIWSRKKIK